MHPLGISSLLNPTSKPFTGICVVASHEANSFPFTGHTDITEEVPAVADHADGPLPVAAVTDAQAALAIHPDLHIRSPGFKPHLVPPIGFAGIRQGTYADLRLRRYPSPSTLTIEIQK